MTKLPACLRVLRASAVNSVLFFLLFLPLQSQSPTPATSGMLIGPGDTVTIFVADGEELSKTWPVNASGFLNLPTVGRVQAAGLTPEQLEKELADRLKRYLKNPQVTVSVADYKSRPVTISGAVERPGFVQLQGPTPLYSALLQVGGPNKDAGPTLTLTRKIESGAIPHPRARLSDDGKYSSVELAVPDVTRGYGQDAALTVMPYDVVTIAEGKKQRLVYISGEVQRPGAIELVTQDTISVSKALATAGGFTKTAKAGKAMIRHINADGMETAVAFVDLNKVLSGKVADFALSDGDVVIVPSSTLRQYAQVASQSAVTQGIWILARF